MTALAMKGDVERCVAAGMDDYVSKPIRRQQLVETLQRWIPATVEGEGDASPAEEPDVARSQTR